MRFFNPLAVAFAIDTAPRDADDALSVGRKFKALADPSVDAAPHHKIISLPRKRPRGHTY
jgi:hypothetical protein